MKAHMISFVLLSAVLGGAVVARAEDPVDIPDPALKAAVMEALGLTTDPTPSDMLDLTEFNAVGRGIVDVTGLEHAANLISLNLGDNQIADLAPLAGLTNLTSLELGENSIADISALSNLTNLTALGLAFNKVADLSALSGLTALRYLDLFTNEISDISPLSPLTDLQGLWLGYNQVVDISPLANLTNLTRLQLQCNQINDISAITGLTNLEELDLLSNEISDITALSGLTQLRMLQLLWNQVSDISPLSGLTNLTLLDLGQNRITDIGPLAGLTNLQDLLVWHNELTDIAPLANLVNLDRLIMPDNLIADLAPLAALTKVTILELNGNQISDISALTEMTTLVELNLNTNPLSAEACAVDIPLIRANNPGVTIHCGACSEQVCALTLSATAGGAVVMPGEGAFEYLWGDLVPVEAVSDEGYQFTHWSGTAVDANAMLDSSAIHTSVFMDADYSLTAHFEPQDEPWSTVYFNEFDDEVGPEWSHNLVDATPIGQRRFLGQFGNDTVTLTLTDLPPHTAVRLTVDLFVIRSWDGDGVPAPPGMPEGRGPDMWSVTLNSDARLLETTFDNHWVASRAAYHRQSYPHDYPGPGVLPQTGAAETGSLGYVREFDPDGLAELDSVYHLRLTCEDSTTVIRVDFAGSGLQELSDESWGLGNVRVEVLAPVVETVLTVSSTAGGSVTYPGEGASTCDLGAAVSLQATAEANHHFTHWSGTGVDAGKVADPGSPNTHVVVDADYTVVANFAIDQRTLTVSSTAGGSVTDPGEGALTYDHGASVSLQAAADAHYHFTHWSGTAVDAGKVVDPESPNTTVTVDADYTLVANFTVDQHRLTVSAAEGGYVTTRARMGGAELMWEDDVSLVLDHGTEITVTATAYAPWHFISWIGTMGSSDPSFTFVLTGDCHLEALFGL